MPNSCSLIFWICLLFFFCNLLPRVEYERNSGLKFFYLFLGLSHPISSPFSLKITVESCFFNFLNFFWIFFLNFLPRVEYERNSGLTFFFISFLAYLILSNPVLAKTNAGKLFFNFFNFFAVFFLEFSPPGRVWEEFGSKIILSLSRPISSYLVPFLLKITTESCFLVFLNFFAIFFRNFLPRVEYERNWGLKLFSLFLGLSHPNLAKNNAE